MDGHQKHERGRSGLPAIVNGKHEPETARHSRLKRALKDWFGKNPPVEIEPLLNELRTLKADFVTLCTAAEKSEREMLARIAELTETVEELKKREPVAAPAPQPPRTQPDCAPPVAGKRNRLPGWTVREVQNDIALVEGRNRLVEVSPGQKVRGFGQIKAIERDGETWIVVTTRGVILSEPA